MQGGHFYGRKTDRGIYREWGKAPQSLNPGDVVNIPPGSNTGTVQRRTAGSRTWRLKCRARARTPNGLTPTPKCNP